MLYARETAMKALIVPSRLTSKFMMGLLLLSYSMNACDCCPLVIHALFLFVENIIGSLFPFLFSRLSSLTLPFKLTCQPTMPYRFVGGNTRDLLRMLEFNISRNLFSLLFFTLFSLLFHRSTFLFYSQVAQ